MPYPGDWTLRLQIRTPAGQAPLTSVLNKAAQLGMEININPCGSTSCGSPAVTLADSMQELIPFNQTVMTSTANQSYSAPSPAPTGVPGNPSSSR